jgi:hypothetical protein
LGDFLSVCQPILTLPSAFPRSPLIGVWYINSDSKGSHNNKVVKLELNPISNLVIRGIVCLTSSLDWPNPWPVHFYLR